MKDNLPSAAVALICVLVLDKYGTPLEASEFRGARVTGVLLDLYEIGFMMFVIGLFLPFVWRRVAAVSGLVAAFLCSPVFLYGIFPALFRRLFPGDYKVPLLPRLYADKWTVFGIVIIAFTSFLNVRILLRGPRTKEGPHKSVAIPSSRIYCIRGGTDRSNLGITTVIGDNGNAFAAGSFNFFETPRLVSFNLASGIPNWTYDSPFHTADDPLCRYCCRPEQLALCGGRRILQRRA
jgi:hypothetical protein